MRTSATLPSAPLPSSSSSSPQINTATLNDNTCQVKNNATQDVASTAANGAGQAKPAYRPPVSRLSTNNTIVPREKTTSDNTYKPSTYFLPTNAGSASKDSTGVTKSESSSDVIQ
uniref:Uncharacterized protein n=1 Tax=Lygus hesperus TaxID=30085 RepID=A0A0A9YDK3_LYGHE